MILIALPYLFHQKDLTPLTSSQEATTFFLCSGYCVRLVVWDSATLRLPVLAFLHRVLNTIALRLLSSHTLLAPAHDVPDCCTANSADLGNTTATPSRIGYTYPSAAPTGRGAHVLDSIGAADPRAWHVRCRRPSVRVYTRRRDHLPALVAWCPTYSVLLYTPRLLLRNFVANRQSAFHTFSSTSPSRLGKFLTFTKPYSPRGSRAYAHGKRTTATVMVASVSVVSSFAFFVPPRPPWSPPSPVVSLVALVASASVVASFTASVVVS